MKKWLALGMLAAVGCSGERFDYVIAVAPSATAGEVEAVRASAEAWNACGVVRIDVRQGAPMSDEIVAMPVAELSVNGEPADGLTQPDRQSTVFRRGLGIRERETVAHELGHIIGLDHSSEGLMQARQTEEVQTVGAAECAALRARHERL